MHTGLSFLLRWLTWKMLAENKKLKEKPSAMLQGSVLSYIHH